MSIKKLLGWILSFLILVMPASVLAGSNFTPVTFSWGDTTWTFKQMPSLSEDSTKDREYWPRVENGKLIFGITYQDTSAAFMGSNISGLGAAVVTNLTFIHNDKSTSTIAWLYRVPVSEFPKTSFGMVPLAAWFEGPAPAKEVVGVNSNGKIYLVFANCGDIGNHWAGSAISVLVENGILISAAGDSEPENAKYRLFNPNHTALVCDTIAWLVMAFTPAHIDTASPAPQWLGDPSASDQYLAEYGYSYLVKGKNISIPTKADLVLFSPIDAALKMGVLTPESDGTLGLKDDLTRAHFCQLAARAKGMKESPEATSSFWDLKNPEWNANLGSIGACVSNGILKGCPDGSFSPEGTMTRAEVAVAIYKLLGLGSVPQNPNTITPTHTTLIQSFQVGSPTMTVNGKPVAMDVTPMVVEDRTLLPARYVAEPLGAYVTWSPTDQKVTITSTRPWIRLDKTLSTTTATTVELWIGNPTAKVNGVEVPIDPANPKVTPLILPLGRTMVPLRFLGEALGAQVSWKPDTREIVIVSGPPQPLQEKTLPPP